MGAPRAVFRRGGATPLRAGRWGDRGRARANAPNPPVSIPAEARSGGDWTSALRRARGERQSQSLRLGRIFGQENGGKISGAHKRRCKKGHGFGAPRGAAETVSIFATSAASADSFGYMKTSSRDRPSI